MNMFFGLAVMYLAIGLVLMGLTYTFAPQLLEAWLGAWICSLLMGVLGVYVEWEEHR